MPRLRLSVLRVPLVVVVLATGLPWTASAATVPPAGAVPPAAWEPSATVTLITGDKVVVHGSDVQIEPKVQGTAFSVRRDAGRVTVVPSTVGDLVPSVLDPALFDVTGLVEMQYDDAHRADLPVITQGAPAGARAGLRAPRELASVGAVAGTLAKDGGPLAWLTSRRAPTKIWLDRKLAATSVSSSAASPSTSASAPDQYLQQVQAPAAWARGLDGRGVKVAVLDTGVDSGHPALAGKVTAAENFTTSAEENHSNREGPAETNGEGDRASAEDDNGHGTHVASLVVGNGAGSDGARQGIAPAAELISGKVLAADGFGQESWVIAGMEWAAAQGADVVNLSLSSTPGDGDDLVSTALDRLTESSGTLFVAAAGNRGNFGATPYTIGSPGIAASALTVGAVDAAGQQANFSSEGPTKGTYRLKPDLAAPGVEIPGARAGARDGDLYVPMSGTSQATPLVTGAAALLLQESPAKTWQQLKTAVVASTVPAGAGWTLGNGRLDLAHQPTLSTDLASLDFGYLRHPDKQPRSQVVTVTNSGTTPVTLPVTDVERTPTAVTAPAEAVTAEPSTLTVPAGGTASTRITVDPALLPDDRWEGTVSLGALRLALGLYDEPPRYDLTVKVLDRNGTPYAGGKVTAFDYVTGNSNNLTLDAQGTAKARLAPGRWSLLSAVTTPASTDAAPLSTDAGARPGEARPATFALAGTAELAITGDTTYVIDARKAQALRTPTLDGQPTRLAESAVSVSRHSASRGVSDFWFFTPEQIAAGTVFIQPTTKLTGSGSFEAANRWRLEPTGKPRPSDPAAYELLLVKDRFPLPAKLTRQDVARMARVDNTFGSISGTGEQVLTRAWSTKESGVGWVNRRTIQVPSHQLELLTADPGALWNQCLTATTGTDLCDRENLPFPARAQVDRSFAQTLHPTMFVASHSQTSMFVDVGLGDAFHRGKPPASAYQERRIALSRENTPVGEAASGSAYFPVPRESARFRLEQSWTLDPAVFPTANKASTVWNYTSAAPDPTKATGVPPALLEIGYDAAVDGFGRAPAWRPLTIDLLVDHLTGSTASRVTGAKLWYSSDNGRRWTQALVVPVGGKYTALVPPWSVLPGKTLSLRAVATDAAGGSIDQTVLNAIPVT
ncbi:S8 family serine peptidase [Kribbella sp. DT2]|uniref:S8 family serine peptidase n=1 Tax=Kribbella sp. DT2 TaxID=3393427 RepID=UPI003CED52BF